MYVSTEQFEIEPREVISRSRGLRPNQYKLLPTKYIIYAKPNKS